jgi:hypothetical protein
MDAVEALLEHAGVKGMKWGIRKDRNRTSSFSVVNPKTGEKYQVKYDPSKLQVNTETGVFRGSKSEEAHVRAQLASAKKHMDDSDSPSTDFKTAAALRAKPASSLSNADMKALVDRMDMERKYSDAIAKSAPPKILSKKEKAKKFAFDLLSEIGQAEVKRVSKGSAALRVEQLLKASGDKHLMKVGERITPGKKDDEKKPEGK